MEQINEQHPHRGDWLRDIVFGLNDGLVTTLVFIMAVSEVAPACILLIVLGEVLAGGISMALGGFLSARTAKQILDQRIATERYEIEHEPEEERAELRAIYQNKGLSGPSCSVLSAISRPIVTDGTEPWSMTNWGWSKTPTSTRGCKEGKSESLL